jgi:hypothetical protein
MTPGRRLQALPNRRCGQCLTVGLGILLEKIAQQPANDDERVARCIASGLALPGAEPRPAAATAARGSGTPYPGRE